MSAKTDALPVMMAAFRTTTSGPSGYTMQFRFPDLATLHTADDEWIAFRQADPTTAANTLRSVGLLTDADYHRTINRIAARERLRGVMG